MTTKVKQAPKVLLVIDMVKGFLEPKTKDGPCALYIKGAKELIGKINREIKALPKGSTVIFMRDTHKPDDKEFEKWPKHCVEDTEECLVAEGFMTYLPDINYVNISKTRFSAFFESKLDDFLWNNGFSDVHRHGVDTEIILTGVCTDICVFATALDARYRDYTVRIITDCVKALDEVRGKQFLAYLASVAGVKLTTQETE
jgi:nicotinamidase/pyrazinamidase